MIEDTAGMGARPMPKKTRRGKRNRGKRSDPMATLKAAHDALDRGDTAAAKRLALAAVNALHRSGHAHTHVTEPASPVVAAATPSANSAKPAAAGASRLVNALRFKKTA